MQTRILHVLFLVSLMMAPVRAGEEFQVLVSPVFAFEPAFLTVRTSITAAHDNRFLEVVAESAGYFRSSTVQLDGERAPRTTHVAFRSVPSGDYTVRVIVRGPTGEKRMQTERTVRVIDRRGSAG